MKPHLAHHVDPGNDRERPLSEGNRTSLRNPEDSRPWGVAQDRRPSPICRLERFVGCGIIAPRRKNIAHLHRPGRATALPVQPGHIGYASFPTCKADTLEAVANSDDLSIRGSTQTVRWNSARRSKRPERRAKYQSTVRQSCINHIWLVWKWRRSGAPVLALRARHKQGHGRWPSTRKKSSR